ncbi:MAG: GerAB/ArcD/ProY family transporter, partial [Angelakisella sp.]
KLLLLLLMMAAGVFAAFQGLEGMARTAPIILLLTAGGLLMLGVGAAGSMHLAYLPPLTLTAEEAFGLSAQSGMANTELAALLFLQPQATKPLRKGAIAAWLAAGAVLSAAIILAVLLCLGGYAETVPSPVLAVAQCAGLSVFPHLDPALMGIIILLGFVRTSLYCFLCALLWRKLFGKRRRAGRACGEAAVSLLFCLSLLSGCGTAEESIGAKTIVTMLEVEYSPRCVVRAEYRMVGSGEKEAEYGVYSGEGDSFALALAAIERKESVRLFTESCGTVAIHKVGGEEKTTALLEEINACGKIRPMTAMFLCEGRLLCEEREGGASMGRGLEKLFVKNGGMIEEKYTLKDSIACGRELRLALTLPVVVPNKRGDGVWFVNFENFSAKNLC